LSSVRKNCSNTRFIMELARDWSCMEWILFWADGHHTFSRFNAGTGCFINPLFETLESSTSSLHSAATVGVIGTATVLFVGTVVDKVTGIPFGPWKVEVVLNFLGTAEEVIFVAFVVNAGDKIVVVDVVFAFVFTEGTVFNHGLPFCECFHGPASSVVGDVLDASKASLVGGCRGGDSVVTDALHSVLIDITGRFTSVSGG
jgi:hypothetical protein